MPGAGIDDLEAEYRAYLDRFARELGEVQVGGFAKFDGQLIKKLTFEELAAAYAEYRELVDHYTSSLERGDTINNIVLRLVREKAAHLVMKPPPGA
ncbi:MAG: hypothetical protein KF773_13410 [Deltaproteobacteria bacterium]|nr:hypothetical protein [Deltaproteobacteria bacterium]MCW5803372.1 hypothetical protein [Deltaproteobacteria bacterium]